ncbi:MAG: pyrroline-5-carboxylate reductase dimerization domain-containing protein [Pseudomonadota bacterium]
MDTEDWSLGIVGGTGMLGREIAAAIVRAGVVPTERLWISSRRGADGAPDALRSCNHTTRNQALADACDVILISVPPAAVNDIAIKARDKLIISVMAGVSIETLQRTTGSSRVVRAMSSPAAGQALAYSPWCAHPEVTEEDRSRTQAILSVCGLTDEIEAEAHIDCFTALTGPVPGFVAFFAEAMADYAESQGIAPELADRAVRQLFRGAAAVMSDSAMTPSDHVQQMIDYAGTTAAGLQELRRLGTGSAISQGLDAAKRRAGNIAPR